MAPRGLGAVESTMSLKVSSLEVLRIVGPIGGVETNHLAVWSFPDLNAHGGEATQTNLIFPEPARFLRNDLPVCSVIRSTQDDFAGAVATIKAFTADKLFEGQSARLSRTVMRLAREADAAPRRRVR